MLKAYLGLEAPHPDWKPGEEWDQVVSSYAIPSSARFPDMRFVVDAGAVLHLASAEVEVAGVHKLLAPTLLRSQTLSALHEAVQRGEIPADVARDRLTRIGRMPIRLLGDAVLRRRAWELADQLGWSSTYNAEYIALTQLQADAFITLDAELARSVEGIVATASIDALR
jgi:predicted nucleic acid-binding protein